MCSAGAAERVVVRAHTAEPHIGTAPFPEGRGEPRGKPRHTPHPPAHLTHPGSRAPVSLLCTVQSRVPVPP